MQGKRINDIVNRMHVAMPKQRDGSDRPAVIPPSVALSRSRKAAAAAAVTERELQVMIKPT